MPLDVTSHRKRLPVPQNPTAAPFLLFVVVCFAPRVRAEQAVEAGLQGSPNEHPHQASAGTGEDPGGDLGKSAKKNNKS